MNHTPPTNQSKADSFAAELDLFLQSHLAAPAEHILPSSGFASSVMDAIQQKASEPPPIGFPWKRVLPGAIAMLCALIIFCTFLVRGGATALTVNHTLDLNSLRRFFNDAAVTGSILLAVFISLAVIAASFRIAGRSR